MKKNGNRSSADSSLKVDESGKKSEKVMVPFFESDESTVSISLKPPRSSQSRRPRFFKGNSDPQPSRNPRFPGRKDTSKPPLTKEVGLGGEPSRLNPNDGLKNSWPLLKPRERPHFNGTRGNTNSPGFNAHDANFNNDHGANLNSTHGIKLNSAHGGNVNNAHGGNLNSTHCIGTNSTHVVTSTNVVVRETRIAYIDRNNVGNIRPLTELYDKNDLRAPSETPGDVVHKIKREFKPSLTCELDPIGRQSTFVDALIRNSNSFEDVVVDDSHRLDRPNKSQELKSVLTKMGILDKTHSQKDDSCFPELEKDLGNRYVFPKYMTSPDPSSIPIPGSL
ncbi:hypothetical protein MACK_003086 [Theileria orientalis]|uniref:Uncharacterized protein n=1 Tax=Theileria orientalis TaxID=68886 RepID=A0A976ME40_THEOR|nr:hypothetical protein MACK_003086 [Theileria orientalis]